MNLRLITGPDTEPVTVAEVKLYAHIDHSVEDALVEGWIKTARAMAEDYQRRAYYTQTWEMSFDRFPLLPLWIPRPPLLEVLSVKYYDYRNVETSYDFSTYMLVDADSEPGRIDHAYSETWPAVTLRPMNSVKIRYKCGYADDGTTTSSPDYVVQRIPQAVKDAIMLYCSWHNDNRGAEAGEAPAAFYSLLNPGRMHI